MKKLLGILAISALAASAFAQGTINLLNQTGLVQQWTAVGNDTLKSAPAVTTYIEVIAAPSGTTLANPLFTTVSGGYYANYSSLEGFLAANTAWALTAGTANPAAPTPLLAAGIFSGGGQSINNITAGANAAYMVLGWTGGFSTFDAALTAELGDPTMTSSFLGLSAIDTTATGNPTATPPGIPVALKRSFGGVTLAPVTIPEPTSFALAGLGLAALLVFRRRN